MTIYVNTYNDLMFHDEEKCRYSLEQSFLNNELEIFFIDYHEETKRMITSLVHNANLHAADINDFCYKYELKLESFIDEYMQEIDEEKAEDYEAGGCDWGD